MKMKFTELTRPRSASGVESWIAVPRSTTLTASAMPATMYASTESGNQRDSPNTIVAMPYTATAASNAPARPSESRQEDQHRRHRERAELERRREQAVADLADREDVARVDRQQRRRAAENHREHVERHAAEHDRAAPHELEPLADRRPADPRAAFAAPSGGSRVSETSEPAISSACSPYARRDAALRRGEAHQHRPGREAEPDRGRHHRDRAREHARAARAAAGSTRARADSNTPATAASATAAYKSGRLTWPDSVDGAAARASRRAGRAAQQHQAPAIDRRRRPRRPRAESGSTGRNWISPIRPSWNARVRELVDVPGDRRVRSNIMAVPEKKRLVRYQRNGRLAKHRETRVARLRVRSAPLPSARNASRAARLSCARGLGRGALRGCAAVPRRAARERRASSRARALSRSLGGSGARFERVRSRVDGDALVGVLKVHRARSDLRHAASGASTRSSPPGFPRACRARSRPARSPAASTAGCCSRSSRRRDAGDPSVRTTWLREIARVHRATLGRVPDWLPRPFSRDLAAGSSRTCRRGSTRLESLQRREPLLRDLATPRAISLARALVRDLAPLRREFARSPECLVHRDLHPGQRLAARDGRADPVRLGGRLAPARRSSI